MNYHSKITPPSKSRELLSRSNLDVGFNHQLSRELLGVRNSQVEERMYVKQRSRNELNSWSDNDNLLKKKTSTRKSRDVSYISDESIMDRFDEFATENLNQERIRFFKTQRVPHPHMKRTPFITYMKISSRLVISIPSSRCSGRRPQSSQP